MGSAEGAEDVVQDAYLAAVRQFGSGEPPTDERAWFLRVVANLAKYHVRREVHRRDREAAMVAMCESQPVAAVEPDLLQLLRREIAILDERMRVPIALCYEEGLSQREAAIVLEVDEGTVSRRLQAGLEQLRKVLARAGYKAAPAAVIGALAHTAPAVPDSLAAAVEKIVAGQVAAEGAGTGSATVAAAAKGGLTMKIVLGVMGAGVLAGVVAVAVPKVSGPEALPAAAQAAPAAPVEPRSESKGALLQGERKDPPENQVYDLRILVWNFWSTGGGMLDGPAGMAESTDLIKGHDVDDVGNVYWAECDSPVIRRYSPKTDRVETIAGGIRGLADGPIARARFGGWSYNSTNLICVSGDGKHLFVCDQGGKGQWRYLDLEAGTVTSLGQWHHFQKDGYYLIARDKSGEIYAFVTNGADPPDCKGYKKLKVAPSKAFASAWYAFDRYVLDAEKMRLYFHRRGPVNVCDLKTGEITCVTAEGRDERTINTSGPLETTTFLCPTGMSISPAGRYLYVGQGDGSSCFRLDFEKKQATVFGGLDGGGFGWRDSGKDTKMTGSTGWPAAVNYIPDGRGFWANCWGLYSLTPKGGN
jgi:RNA polymerase sigma factor (sigma-70 family)